MDTETSNDKNATLSIDARAPVVREAVRQSDGSYILNEQAVPRDYFHVDVPHYPGMATGHSVRVTTVGPDGHVNSVPRTVTTPGVMTFQVRRVEAVDAIGKNFIVNYTIEVFDNAPVIASNFYRLRVAPQSMELRAPVSIASNRVSVSYCDMQTGHIVRVRCVGVGEWDSAERTITATGAVAFDLDPQWLANNRGRDVFINYRVRKSASDARGEFSRVLRMRLP